ncbi:MAG: DNA polymerase III subunit gamma/tau [Phycisphaerae bacterium]|nr:DNA polymerase III subunit gamma/tau [Phycisphaerae bacterium]
MAYTVLARRYRSAEFDQVVGQEPIARTLQAAVAQGRVAHAYLFTGTRGVGKTSTARLLAKALAGGTPEADAAIMQGRDTDVIEIDAASNSKVEETRELIANAVYRPLRGKKKVYIIDECHMLSSASFNALLKTMEEPPEHVVFILCTTEAHKVPATIQSRCQRFDFRNIAPADIASHLGRVLQQEGVRAEPELLHAVARLAAGSMRDSLSLLDRLLASGEKHLTLGLLHELLGLPDRELVSAVVDALASGDAAAALDATDELIRRGLSPEMMLESLIDRLRDLMLLAQCGRDTTLVATSGAAREQDLARAARFDAAALVHMIAVAESVHRSLRYSSHPRAILDAAMVRLAHAEKFADVAAILAGEPGAAPAKKH